MLRASAHLDASHVVSLRAELPPARKRQRLYQHGVAEQRAASKSGGSKQRAASKSGGSKQRAATKQASQAGSAEPETKRGSDSSDSSDEEEEELVYEWTAADAGVPAAHAHAPAVLRSAEDELMASLMQGIGLHVREGSCVMRDDDVATTRRLVDVLFERIVPHVKAMTATGAGPAVTNVPGWDCPRCGACPRAFVRTMHDGDVVCSKCAVVLAQHVPFDSASARTFRDDPGSEAKTHHDETAARSLGTVAPTLFTRTPKGVTRINRAELQRNECRDEEDMRLARVRRCKVQVTTRCMRAAEHSVVTRKEGDEAALLACLLLDSGWGRLCVNELVVSACVAARRLRVERGCAGVIRKTRCLFCKRIFDAFHTPPHLCTAAEERRKAARTTCPSCHATFESVVLPDHGCVAR